MANKKSEPLDLDDLLNDDELLGESAENKEAPKSSAKKEPAEPKEAPTETADQKRIRELEAELSKPVVKRAEPEIPKPESQLSEEQKRIRELEDLLARRKTTDLENAEPEYEDVEGETILLHVLEDGFTACGQIWYRGQEIEFVRGSVAHKQQLDRNGDSWLDLIEDIDAQFDKWGRQMIAAGPWRGRKWGDTSTLKDDDDIDSARRAAEVERKRGRKAPVIHV